MLNSQTDTHKLYRVLHLVTQPTLFGERRQLKDTQIVADTIDFDAPFTLFYLTAHGTKLLSAAFKTSDIIAIIAKAIVQQGSVEMGGNVSKAEKNRLETTISRALRELGYERDSDGHFVKSANIEDEE